MTPDVNILVAAFRADHPHYRPAKRLLDTGPGAQAPLALVPMVAAAFVRLVTSSRVFPDPAPVPSAAAFIDALLARPGTRWAAARDEWRTLRALCVEKRPGGNGVPDAWLAATVIVLGEHLVTFDAGFRRLLPRRQLTVLAP